MKLAWRKLPKYLADNFFDRRFMRHPVAYISQCLIATVVVWLTLLLRDRLIDLL